MKNARRYQASGFSRMGPTDILLTGHLAQYNMHLFVPTMRPTFISNLFLTHHSLNTTAKRYLLV